MIFDEIVSETAERLNLSSDEAKSRIGREINRRYQRVTSSIGLETSRRTQVSKAATIGSRVITFTGIEKIIAVLDRTNPTSEIILNQVTMDDMHSLPVKTTIARNYAVTNMHSTSVDIYIDSVPATAFVLYADGHVTLSTLAGNATPDFPESFHEILVFGAMADEYRKMEKLQFAQACELDYEKRLSDLRMWIAKSAYLDEGQGFSSTPRYPWIINSRLI